MAARGHQATKRLIKTIRNKSKRTLSASASDEEDPEYHDTVFGTSITPMLISGSGPYARQVTHDGDSSSRRSIESLILPIQGERKREPMTGAHGIHSGSPLTSGDTNASDERRPFRDLALAAFDLVSSAKQDATTGISAASQEITARPATERPSSRRARTFKTTDPEVSSKIHKALEQYTSSLGSEDFNRQRIEASISQPTFDSGFLKLVRDGNLMSELRRGESIVRIQGSLLSQEVREKISEIMEVATSNEEFGEQDTITFLREGMGQFSLGVEFSEEEHPEMGRKRQSEADEDEDEEEDGEGQDPLRRKTDATVPDKAGSNETVRQSNMGWTETQRVRAASLTGKGSRVVRSVIKTFEELTGQGTE